MTRVLLIASGDAGRVVLLARQIELHAPGARVCGIIYSVPSSSQLGLVSRARDLIRLLGIRVTDWVMGLIHRGWLQRLETTGSPRDILSRKCQGAGWNFCLTTNVMAPKVLEFARLSDPDLGVVVGLASIPVALASLPKRKTIRGELCSLDRQGSEEMLKENACVSGSTSAIRVRVLRVADGQADSQFVNVELFRQPLDTHLSLELKGNLMLRDLLTQSVAALACHPDEKATVQVSSWAQDMFPSCFTSPDTGAINGIRDEAPPLRVRSRWMLCVYSLFLISPFFIFRNWFRSWKKQHPVVFLNSHLISDRHHRMTLPTEAFLREVQFLRRHYRIVSLSEATKLLKSGRVSEPTAVLTLDRK